MGMIGDEINNSDIDKQMVVITIPKGCCVAQATISEVNPKWTFLSNAVGRCHFKLVNSTTVEMRSNGIVEKNTNGSVTVNQVKESARDRWK